MGAAPLWDRGDDMHKRMLRLMFWFILVSLLLCTSYASLRQPVWQWTGLKEPPNNWWTIATLMDACYGFLTFFMWVAYKEQRWTSRIAWFVAITLLGNMAMSAYVLRQLARLRPADPLAQLFAARNP
jgi:hypothetical protein